MGNVALVASWNVNSVRARLPVIHSFISNKSPDILLLQEIKVEDVAFPIGFFEDLGFEASVYGQKSFHGVAILSKRQMYDVYKCTFSTSISEARYIECIVGDLRVASVYAPNGTSFWSSRFGYKNEFFKNMGRHLSGLLKLEEKAVIGGDYNVTPSQEDVVFKEKWEGQILCSQEERKMLVEAISGWRDAALIDRLCVCEKIFSKKNIDLTERADTSELVNSFDEVANMRQNSSEKAKNFRMSTGSEGHSPTWWDYRGRSFERNDGLRIDAFFLSPFAAEALKSYEVCREYRAARRTSDHAPILIELT
ncbi:exodeoxyribonuclease III [Candidatus Hydrogenosomobacter endosymbioticus]|uniref:Exodeoxyribonuclease III n=1 Tax=Candidatus Hydrogenosomobacter endosymbioticus TaxID=2558174 RepID=A0ABM7VA18_9PROT|nr:exodeoxyribonuclease III [Candidatus Hydrogenosomobacter endosymbioticus]BDB96319.1 exodeoxyribonuclease III [Candidatus Hydrogenosomobacter endosymbioticus]